VDRQSMNDTPASIPIFQTNPHQQPNSRNPGFLCGPCAPPSIEILPRHGVYVFELACLFFIESRLICRTEYAWGIGQAMTATP
jgi:hypothetical protein